MFFQGSSSCAHTRAGKRVLFQATFNHWVSRKTWTPFVVVNVNNYGTCFWLTK